MGFDRSAHRAQVARIIENAAGDELLLKLNGKGTACPATIGAEKPGSASALESTDPARSIITLARVAAEEAFAGEHPREGQHFTDPAGRMLRIEEDLTVPHSAVYVFACGSFAAITV